MMIRSPRTKCRYRKKKGRSGHASAGPVCSVLPSTRSTLRVLTTLWRAGTKVVNFVFRIVVLNKVDERGAPVYQSDRIHLSLRPSRSFVVRDPVAIDAIGSVDYWYCHA